MSFSLCTADGERLQKRCCSRTGHVVQLSKMLRPWDELIPAPICPEPYGAPNEVGFDKPLRTGITKAAPSCIMIRVQPRPDPEMFQNCTL